MPSRYSAFGPKWAVEWSDTPPHLIGDPFMVRAVTIALESRAGESILVTPTGPMVPSSIDDPLAVRVTLARIEPAVVFSDDTPAVPSVPTGAVA